MSASVGSKVDISPEVLADLTDPFGDRESSMIAQLGRG